MKNNKINESDEKRIALENALESINKTYGSGTVMKMGSDFGLNVETFSTGCYSLDKIIGGGIPKGRIIEVYGPESSGKTTLTLHMIAEVQKNGGIAGFIDAEHALDPSYAKNIGVDVDNLYVSQPDCGEQALEICETMVRSGAIDIVVVDSVAALVPKTEIDGYMGDSHVGLHARLMSQALRKLTTVIGKTSCTVVFINQLREKVGVFYGCLHGNTKIPFMDGRNYPISKIVKERIEGNVWSYNEKKGIFEEKEIVDWHYNGKVNNEDDYIHITTSGIDCKNGINNITVTPDHKIMTKSGWKKAKDITINDFVLTKYKSVINHTLSDFIYGTIIGDCNISFATPNTACLCFEDSHNPEYLKWKIEKLSPFFGFHKHSSNNRIRIRSGYSGELAIIKKGLGTRNPLIMLKYHFSWLGMALWYMDDGHFDNVKSNFRSYISIKRFKKDPHMLSAICNELLRHGLKCSYYNNGAICFNKESTIKLMENICQYIPEPMQYKLADQFKNKYIDFSLESSEECREIYVPVKKIRTASKRQMKDKGKYDISIADNHNYMAGNRVNGIVVHNSPETTTGGNALKFYSSIRIDIRKKETVKVDGQAVYNKTMIKVVKNKIAPPFKKTIVDISFGEGISIISDILDSAIDQKIIQKSGSWFSYNDTKIGQGRESAKKFLEDNKDILDEIRNKLS